MKIHNRISSVLFVSALLSVSMISCDKDDDSPRNKEYAITAENNNGVTGKLSVTENTNKSFNIQVDLNKSVKDTVHIIKLVNGSVANPGTVAIDLGTVTGTGAAVSKRTNNLNQVKLPDNTNKTLTYDSLLNYNAFIAVYYSATKSDSIIAKGNIGKSVAN